MKKIALGVGGIFMLLVLAFFWLNSYIYQEKQADAPNKESVSMEGEYLCLPTTDHMEQPTADCAAGIRNINGAYYALDLGLLSVPAPALVAGDMISASGVMTPIEDLSTDYWEKYPIQGIFSVTDSLEVTGKAQKVESPLLGNAWVWQRTEKADGSTVKPDGESFVLSFLPTEQYTSSTDCNALSGTFVVDKEVLSLSPAIATKMYCEGSLETAYTNDLMLTDSFVIDEDLLRLNLNRDNGTMIFAPLQ